MKKFSFSICLLLIAVLCCSCGFFGDQAYTCDIGNIESIQLVRLDEFIDSEHRYAYTVLCDITAPTDFAEKLTAIDHNVNWGDPRVLPMGDVVIKINYLNGDFDLLHPDAQTWYRSGEYQSGFFFFDDDQFGDLVRSYYND